jgi:hypothetical protein
MCMCVQCDLWHVRMWMHTMLVLFKVCVKVHIDRENCCAQSAENTHEIHKSSR